MELWIKLLSTWTVLWSLGALVWIVMLSRAHERQLERKIEQDRVIAFLSSELEQARCDVQEHQRLAAPHATGLTPTFLCCKCRATVDFVNAREINRYNRMCTSCLIDVMQEKKATYANGTILTLDVDDWP